MRVLSNAFFLQAEIVQTNRWQLGPLQLSMVDVPRDVPLAYAMVRWNQAHSAGQIRPGDAYDVLRREVPGFTSMAGPNLVFVPRTEEGHTELHVMLASLLPDSSLDALG